MPIIEPSSPTANSFERYIAAKIWSDPVPQEQQDPLIDLKEQLTEFNEKLAEMEKQVVEHVYQNPDFSLLDARQHRLMLHQYLYRAERLALKFEILKRPGETAAFVTHLDKEIQRLQRIFQDWHGDPETHPGIPESFKEAMREMKAGQTEDMEEDMFAADASRKA